MRQILPIIQIILSVLLVIAVLLQQRGAGAGSAFGGGNGTYSSRRGFEKTLFIGTIIIGTLFFLSTAASLILR